MTQLRGHKTATDCSALLLLNEKVSYRCPVRKQLVQNTNSVMNMDLEISIESFQRWFNGYHLTNNDITIIVLSILTCMLLIFTIVMLVYISFQTLFWTRIGWFLEDVWRWIKRNVSIVSDLYIGGKTSPQKTSAKL